MKRRILAMLMVCAMLCAMLCASAEQCACYITLKKGDSGIRVEEMQKVLIKIGVLSGKASKKYDDATVRAVNEFTSYVNLAGDFKNGKLATAELIEAMFRYARNNKPTPEPEPEPEPEPQQE